MEAVIVGLLSVNLIVTTVLLIKFVSVKNSIRGLKVLYFPEVTEVSGFLKKQKRVQIKAQFMIGEIPIGHPFVMSEQFTETVDEKKVQEIIQNIGKPLAAIGVKILTKNLA